MRRPLTLLVVRCAGALTRPLSARCASDAGAFSAEPPRPRRVRRLRQHINPLAAKSVAPAQLPPGWFAAAFADPTLPLTIDVGSALGGWCVASAADDGSRNFLGLEVRPPAVAAALDRRDRAGLGNAHFVTCNANVDFARFVADAAARGAPLERVLVQFPDPHFKKKHRKRRVATPAFADAVAAALAASAHDAPYLYVASDVLEVAEAMVDTFGGALDRAPAAPADAGGWLLASPLAIPTEREAAVLAGRGATSTAPGTAFRATFVPRR